MFECLYFGFFSFDERWRRVGKGIDESLGIVKMDLFMFMVNGDPNVLMFYGDLNVYSNLISDSCLVSETRNCRG